ncbi:MAG: T9SS type A sorting domain-containing protein [Crocinitomicaceae bacterium]|nr:T9SS type A sorting domain-containing protein [Crocinitomicaceae bacterium]
MALLIYAKAFGGFDIDQCKAMNVDNSNNIYLVGTCRASVDLDPTASIDMSGSGGMFLIKLNENDEYLWSKVLLASTVSAIHDICFDTNDNIVLTGRFQNTVDFDPGINQNLMTSISHTDGFVLKLDSTGSFLWSKRLGSIFTGSGNSPSVSGTAIACDSENNIVWGGYYLGELQIPELGSTEPHYGHYDFFIEKMNESGDILWIETFGNSGIDFLNDINIDDSDNIYFCGNFSETVDFDPGPNVLNHDSPNSNNLYITSFSPNGNLRNSIFFTGLCSSSATRMSISPLGGIYFCGNYSGNLIVNYPRVIETFNSIFYNDIVFGKLDGVANIEKPAYSSNDFQLFPNPSSGVVNISLNSAFQNNFNLEVRDLSGRLIQTMELKTNKTSIDLGGVSDGTYFFTVSDKESILTKKVVAGG